jgi:hypothetical protein
MSHAGTPRRPADSAAASQLARLLSRDVRAVLSPMLPLSGWRVARRILRVRLSPFSDGGFDLADAAQAHHTTMWSGNQDA